MGNWKFRFSFNRGQFQAVIGYSLHSIFFYGFTVFNLPAVFSEGLLAIYTFGLVLMVCCGCCCSCTNIGVSTVPEAFIEYASVSKWCQFCRAHVEVSSHHCEACNKCRRQHVFHNYWVNNCIGRKNSRSYSWSHFGLMVLSLVQVISTLYLSVRIYQEGDEGVALLEVRHIQKFSINDRGYCITLALLFVFGVSLTMFISSASFLSIRLFRSLQRRLHKSREIFLRSNPRKSELPMPSSNLPFGLEGSFVSKSSTLDLSKIPMFDVCPITLSGVDQRQTPDSSPAR